MPGDKDFGKNTRPEDYDKTFRSFRDSGRINDRLVRLELLEMAEGGNPTGGNPDPNFKGIRTEYYKGWKDEDFKQLLTDLGFPISAKAE